MKQLGTREKIMEAAIGLFTAKGYDGTSIRDIAAGAKVNSANISYYFEGKKGLLEACLVSFFEPYLRLLEDQLDLLETDGPEVCLERALRGILHYQSSRHLLTRFVWREVTIDSQTTREITSSYLMKERYFFKKLLGMLVKDQRTMLHHGILIIQLKGMLVMPYLNSQYAGKVWGILPQDSYFAEKYFHTIDEWLGTVVYKGYREGLRLPTA